MSGFRVFIESSQDNRLWQEIIHNLMSSNFAWLKDKGIDYKDAGNYWILNYNQFEATNKYNRLTRATVIDKSGRIISRSFDRFFNKGQPEADPIDFANSEMIEKLDGCFSKETLINFCDGRKIRIKDVVKDKLVGPVWGYDCNSEQIVPTKILAWHMNGRASDWKNITVCNKYNGNKITVINCTSNHLFWTKEGYKAAGKLVRGDLVFRIRERYGTIARSMLLGTMLGDGSMQLINGSWAISWCHSDKQMELTKWYKMILADDSKIDENFGNRSGGYSVKKHRLCVQKSGALEEIADICLDKKKKKSINIGWLDQINEISLATWYMDDGSISYGQKDSQRPRALLHTEGFSETDNDLIIKKLKELFDLDAVKQKYRGYFGIRLNADSAESFWELVAPYVIPCMRYKLPENMRTNSCFWESFVSEDVDHRLVGSEVLEISNGMHYRNKKAKWTKKYDITTETHNFFANDILVHNSLVGVAFPTGDPHQPIWHTRKMLSLHQPDMDYKISGFRGSQPQKFLPLIGQYIKAIPFSNEDTNYTYVFEFLHEISAVISKYKPEHYGLHLIGGRNLVTHEELTEAELDIVANRLGVRRPKRWDAVADQSEIDALIKRVEQEIPNFEGFVFRDKKTGKRVKIKSADYVRLHHLLDKLSYKNLVPLILGGEEGEVLSYFPEAKDRIDKVKSAYHSYLEKAVRIVSNWGAKGLGQDQIARALFGQNPLPKWEIRLKQTRGEKVERPKRAVDDDFISSLIMSYSKLKDPDKIREAIEQKLRAVALGQGTNAGSPKKFLNIIGIRDVETTDIENVAEI
jgi:hypothetical protein